MEKQNEIIIDFLDEFFENGILISKVKNPIVIRIIENNPETINNDILFARSLADLMRRDGSKVKLVLVKKEKK